MGSGERACRAVLRKHSESGPSTVVYDDTPIGVYIERIKARVLAEQRHVQFVLRRFEFAQPDHRHLSRPSWNCCGITSSGPSSRRTTTKSGSCPRCSLRPPCRDYRKDLSPPNRVRGNPRGSTRQFAERADWPALFVGVARPVDHIDHLPQPADVAAVELEDEPRKVCQVRIVRFLGQRPRTGDFPGDDVSKFVIQPRQQLVPGSRLRRSTSFRRT